MICLFTFLHAFPVCLQHKMHYRRAERAAGSAFYAADKQEKRAEKVNKHIII